MRALIVEDDSVVRHLVARVMSSRGHEVTAVASASEGLALHEREPFALMVVDWVLPGLDGLELCQRVRALPRGDDVVILLVTAKDKPHERDTALEAGATDYLAKPIDIPTLQTRLVIAERAVRATQRRREAVTALEEAEARQRAVLEAAPDGIITHDEAGNIRSMNPAALAMFQIDGKFLLERRIDALISPAPPGAEGAPAPSTGHLGRSRAEERVGHRASGESFPLEVSSAEIKLSGGALFTLIVRDLSERKAIESRLMLADRMATVGTLAAGIAHEINNPLAYVVANLGVLEEDLERLAGRGSDPESIERLTMVREAREGAERVRDIVRDLKTFSRPDDRHVAPVDVHTVLESALSMAAKELRHRARVVRRLDDDLPPALVNEARISQVFLNLLVNAAQAIEDGRADRNEVRVSTRAEGDSRIIVEVTDTGNGIPEDVLPRIFDPFFTTKPVGVGTGLGLSIVHSIVTSLGGSIEVDSEPGRGTSVRVTLPAAPRSVTPQPRAASQTPTEASAHILVVDDERFVARALQRALRQHDVEVAPSGVEALELLAQRDFDVVFCDLLMPEMSGMEFFAEVQTRHPQMVPRFVFMTGGAYTPEAQRFLAQVKNRWIEKPFGARQLKEVVREELERRTPA